MSASRPVIAIIGGGPRGVSLLERIGANAAELAPAGVELCLIDDVEPGAGRVWRTDQTRELCMNTLAHAVTLYTDDSATIDGPVRPGPTLYEWSRMALDGAPDLSIPDAHRAVFARTPQRDGLVEAFGSEIAQQRPESHPSRALFGEYIAWCFRDAGVALPEGVTVKTIRARVIGLGEAGGRQVLHFADPDALPLAADAVVTAAGWLPTEPSAEQDAIAEAVKRHPRLRWVAPESPVDQELHEIPDGAEVIVRGLGMGFFDAMALLTIERGGRFVDDPDAVGGLRYEASGREPRLRVISHRGVPFRAKSLYRALPPSAPMRHTRPLLDKGLARPIDFDSVVWPMVLKDVVSDWVDTTADVTPDAVDRVGAQEAILSVIAPAPKAPGITALTVAWLEALEHAIDPFLAVEADRPGLVEAIFPGAGRSWESPADYTRWVRGVVADDLRQGALGVRSPLKQALWAISSARGLASQLGAFGGFDAESRASGFRMLFSVGSMVGSGPPAFRNAQLLALMEAGLVELVGPGGDIEVVDGTFHTRSPRVDGSEVSAEVLVDAWVIPHRVADTADPLVRGLIEAGRVRPFAAAARVGSPVPTAGFDIDPATGRAVRADGSIDAALHITGIPTDDTQHDTIISPMPKTNPSMLRETDRVARSLLAVATRRDTP